MRDVAKARGTAGLTVASTFSGCGGSCLGFEMAGYRVVWANEFVSAARDTYAANHPKTPLDGRDVRSVTAEEVLSAIGLARGELDVFNGSPPCASFSSAGRREQSWGEIKRYSDTRQRTDDLFFEYVRLVKGIQPRAFVAENVAGLTRGVAIGMCKLVMRALEAAGYVVRCKLLDAQWLGVPQARSRAIFVGVRKDIGELPEFPAPLPYRYSLREVLPHLASVGHRGVGERGPEYLSLGGTAVLDAWKVLRVGGHSSKYQSLTRADPDKPSPTILQCHGASSSIACVTVPHEARRFTIDELRVVCGFPADFILTGTYAQQWERLGRAVPPPMMRAVAATLRDGLFNRLGRTRVGFSEAK